MNFIIRFNLKIKPITFIILKEEVINVDVAVIKETNKAKTIILLIIS